MSSDNIDVDEDHIIESAVSNSSGDDNIGNTEENQTQVYQQEQQCWDNSEVTDLSQCPPEPVQQHQQQGAAFVIAHRPFYSYLDLISNEGYPLYLWLCRIAHVSVILTLVSILA
jgi:hypothetical protein